MSKMIIACHLRDPASPAELFPRVPSESRDWKDSLCGSKISLRANLVTTFRFTRENNQFIKRPLTVLHVLKWIFDDFVCVFDRFSLFIVLVCIIDVTATIKSGQPLNWSLTDIMMLFVLSFLGQRGSAVFGF